MSNVWLRSCLHIAPESPGTSETDLEESWLGVRLGWSWEELDWGWDMQGRGSTWVSRDYAGREQRLASPLTGPQALLGWCSRALRDWAVEAPEC